MVDVLCCGIFCYDAMSSVFDPGSHESLSADTGGDAGQAYDTPCVDLAGLATNRRRDFLDHFHCCGRQKSKLSPLAARPDSGSERD